MRVDTLMWRIGLAIVLGGPSIVVAQETPKSVVEILSNHDRSLIRDLDCYVQKNPKADDVDQAYLTLFDRVLEHEWYGEAEPIAVRYLAERPEGPSKPIAQVVGILARAGAGKHAEALVRFQSLLKGLDRDDQDEFAAQVADNLARSAVTAADFATARKVFEALTARFGQSSLAQQKSAENLSRLDKVGKPAPALTIDDVHGKPLKLADLKGKYVLVDFWATFCGPCLNDLPYLQAAYAKYHDLGLEVVAISLDDTREAVIDFARARRIPWREFHNATAGEDAVATFGVTALPASFLIDPAGKVIRLEVRGPALDGVLGSLIRPAAKP